MSRFSLNKGKNKKNKKTDKPFRKNKKALHINKNDHKRRDTYPHCAQLIPILLTFG
jgi:hypothetical protein